MNTHPSQRIEAYRVSEHARIGTLPRHFDRHMMTVECKIYDLLREFSADYTGGYRQLSVMQGLPIQFGYGAWIPRWHVPAAIICRT